MKKFGILFLSVFLISGILVNCDDDLEDELEESVHKLEQLEMQSTDFFLS